MSRHHSAQPTVEFAGRDTAIPDIMRRQHRGVEPLETQPGKRGNRYQGRPFHLWQQSSKFLLKNLQPVVTLNGEIPLVHGDHDCSSFAGNQVDNP